MNRIEKFLVALNQKQRDRVESLIARIVASDIEGMDIKKLKGRENEFRVRDGRIRIQFTRKPKGTNILSIGLRDSNTY